MSTLKVQLALFKKSERQIERKTETHSKRNDAKKPSVLEIPNKRVSYSTIQWKQCPASRQNMHERLLFAGKDEKIS